MIIDLDSFWAACLPEAKFFDLHHNDHDPSFNRTKVRKATLPSPWYRPFTVYCGARRKHSRNGQAPSHQCQRGHASRNSCLDCSISVDYIKSGAGFGLVSMPNSFYRLILFFLTVAKVMNEEQRINVCKTSLNQIWAMLRTSPQNWRNYVTLARSVIAHLDATTFMQQPARASEQAWMIAGLQRVASMDAESGGVTDIAAWCSRQWLVLFQRDPQNIAALRGIGQSWYARAQPVLVRIHRADGSSSSSNGSSARSANQMTSSEEERQSAAATAEAERRTGTQDYVEARGLLQPATEYLERAVAAATAQRALSGDLLATAAEAYMSLGNISSPRVNEQHFRRALQLLRAASQIPNYSLSRYLQQYLDDYGRLLD